MTSVQLAEQIRGLGQGLKAFWMFLHSVDLPEEQRTYEWLKPVVDILTHVRASACNS